MANFSLTGLLSRFATAKVAPAPIAVSTTIEAENTAEVRFGFAVIGRRGLDPNQTYASFAIAQAAESGITLQDNYTAQYIVGVGADAKTFVVDTTLTFAELNAKYSVTPQDAVQVSIPDPERAAGRLGLSLKVVGI